jgi:hypothetical protein
MWMHCTLFKFNMALNSALFLWKLLFFEFLLGILETFLRSISALRVKSCLSADALQLLIFSGILTYLEPKLPLLMIFSSCTILIIKILI